MSFGRSREKIFHLGFLTFGLSMGLGCTQSVPSQFKLDTARDASPAAFEVNELQIEKVTVPVDILWVIDNSASMLTSQTKLKNGLATFARDYLTQAGTDIQLAVITTDTFVANEAWRKYLTTENPQTKKTPLQIRKEGIAKEKEKAPGARPWSPDYAKLDGASLMRTKDAKAGLISKFQSRVLVGTQGTYEEHGFGSVDQFLMDNEEGASPNKLFRKGSQRIIIFLSDEDDQTLDSVGPEPRKLLYSGSYYTGVDAATANKILPAHFTIDCGNVPNVKGEPITSNTSMTLCLRPNWVGSVDRFKTRLDAFFRNLDDSADGNPNYFVTAIVGQNPATIEELRRNTKEKNRETGLTVVTNEIGGRYLELVEKTGNGSFAMDIGADDYTPILKKVGLEIENRSFRKKTTPQTTFTLDRAPDPRDRLVVTVETAGKRLVLESSQYRVTDKRLVLTDPALIALLQPGDIVSVAYQPNEQVPAVNRRK